MDLGGRYGTIVRPMSAPRWLCVLIVAAVIALGAARAEAQVFRPRTGKAAVASKAATPVASSASAKKTGPVAATPSSNASAKKSTRGTARRPARKRGKARGDSDTVVIDDDDDEDVKITDD